jgi:hypothetical protein
VRSLDSIWDERLSGLQSELPPELPSDRVFLKLDTQGWDLQVVAGAAQSLGRILGLQTELSVKPIYEGITRWQEALARMTGLGFELTGLFPVTRDRRFRVVELDCVMARPDEVGPDRPAGEA